MKTLFIAGFALLLWTLPPSASAQSAPPSDLASSLGLSFPSDGASTVVLTKDGKRYLIDTSAKTVKEFDATAAAPNHASTAAAELFQSNCAECHGARGQGSPAIGSPNFHDPRIQKSASDADLTKAIQHGKGSQMPAWQNKLSADQIAGLVVYIRTFGSQAADGSAQTSAPSTAATNTAAPADGKQKIYTPGDDVLVSLPTGRPTDKGGMYINFAHRFPYTAAFTGRSEGAQLFGLDNVAIPSFGFRYGITDALSVGVFRAPSLINRPIQVMLGYNILEEAKSAPFNLMVRVSLEGQDNFRKNYTENIEAILSRSLGHKAQIYLVPTASFNDRKLVAPDTSNGLLSSGILDEPGVDAFSLGIGLSFDIRPTVALMGEVIPTLVNGDELGIHRPAFSFGIQKKIWRHAFTLALTNSPGTTVSQRAATRATFLNDASADTFGGLGFAFNITRQTK